MKQILITLFYTLAAWGGVGLIIVGILDSSFLFMPLGNDLLVLAMTARQPKMLLWWAFLATLGSVIGCFLVDWLARKGGEEGLSRFLDEGRIEYVKKKVEKRAGPVLALTAMLPPPFPFTPFVIGAAAFQYPRARLLAILAGARFARFSLVGLLAIFYGRAILRLANEPSVQYTLIALVVISIIGSALSIARWIRRSRKASSKTRGGKPVEAEAH
jgi:membrane protein YqaA with SNARE-associated domain